MKKYQLDKNNIYDAIFSLVNKRLKQIVELNNQKKLLGEPYNNNYCVDNYNTIYKMITDYIMQIFKGMSIKDPKSNNYLDFIKKVKVMNFDVVLKEV